jgi:hypothetical protein
MIRHRKIRMRMRNHMVSLKEEEVPNEDRLVGEIIFLEDEEEIEEVELNVMSVERQGIRLGNVPILHIIFIPMIVNDVKLSIFFKGVSGLSS